MPAHHPVPDFLYSTAWKEDRTQALTELSLRMGFRRIDTGNQRRHYFEEGVGQGLAAAYRAGLVTRADLFLQTEFTYQPSQDHRLPYDPAADLSTQVAQSMASSLEHLGTDYTDSYVLHGPFSGSGWTDADAEVWSAMVVEVGIAAADALRAEIRSVMGTAQGQMVQVASLEVGETKAGPLRIIAHDADLKTADGLLGRDFLEQFTGTIDAKGRLVTLVPM